ncbi:hypothetical protein PPTG_24606 [Phytophthora nicotianae INRA-310]|uniref:DUF7869 domain-containing protein n=1 Tax=Phytophthora nicotianae (strain INRA-310) TaxID=761204 RepID=W2PE54_PHYN3|nr:hypothetical protein PPTG_24606 [Phytophthora nicotianae INRA-310]ETM98488.1 hypothetical protein PPTG_24606 [Phytophthora nicotianae INRA-310]
MQTDTATRRRGKGEREKFHYYLSFVGQVCRSAFAHCLGVKSLTIQRYKRRVRERNIAAKEHGNKLNKNASSVDVVWLVKWFKEFAAEVGDVVPVRVRTQKTKDGVVNKYYSREDYTLLPATFNWNVWHEEMHKYVALGLHMNEPAPSTIRKLLSIHCPKIKIRSDQSNVCDLCTVYQTRMRYNGTADQTEELGKDTESARRMSGDEASSDLAVIVMDFSQNLTIPSVACTPSQWYFCSLLAVNVFGIFFDNTGTQTTTLIPYGNKHLVVYADNCMGQNKNNHVIKFFVALVHMGVLERVDYKLFVKGHTKNSCDRGFGHIRKHVSRQDCWTMNHIISAVDNSATSNTTVHISRGNLFFTSYKPVVTELYKNLTSVQQYQVFSMVKDQPGVVLCRKGPDNEATRQDLRRNVDGVATDDIKVDRIEKMLDLHNKIHPYVPEEFQDDPIYAKPSELQQEDAKAAKQARREHRASMVAAAKANQDRRGRDVQDEIRPTPKTARKQSRSILQQTHFV